MWWRRKRGYTCRCCGQFHAELPMHYGAEAPIQWYAIAPEELERRVVLSKDQCVIDDQFFFIVGNLEIPVIGSKERFSWDVWVSLSDRNFARARELWEQPGRESEPAYFGWLSTALPGYPETVNLKTMVQTRELGRRPSVELEPTDHPLAIEQRDGITMARVQEIAELVLHGQSS
jgi:hypothetical protein